MKDGGLLGGGLFVPEGATMNTNTASAVTLESIEACLKEVEALKRQRRLERIAQELWERMTPEQRLAWALQTAERIRKKWLACWI